MGRALGEAGPPFVPLTFQVSGGRWSEGGAHFALSGAKCPASWRTDPARADTSDRQAAFRGGAWVSRYALLQLHLAAEVRGRSDDRASRAAPLGPRPLCSTGALRLVPHRSCSRRSALLAGWLCKVSQQREGQAGALEAERQRGVSVRKSHVCGHRSSPSFWSSSAIAATA
jgi:hypothetical protein